MPPTSRGGESGSSAAPTGSTPSGFFPPAASAAPSQSTATSYNYHSSHNYYHSNNSPQHPSSSSRSHPLRRQQYSSYQPYGSAPPMVGDVPYSATTTTTTTSNRPNKRPRTTTDNPPDATTTSSSGDFACTPCRLTFATAQALAAHQRSHVTCQASGCTFAASPTVVKGHYQAVHGKYSAGGFKTVTVQVPGGPLQRFRICVGNHPDDVQKWRDERRKKFPRLQPSSQQQQVPAGSGNSSHTTAAHNHHSPAAEKTGLAALLDGYSSASSSNEDEDDNDGNDKTNNNSNGGKEAPVSATAATDATTIDTANAATIDHVSDAHPDNNNRHTNRAPPKKPCHSFVRHGHCRRGNACPYSHDPSLRQNASHPSNPPGTTNNRNHPPPRRPPLLEKLLQGDAQRECQLTLQLIHYLVESDFLAQPVAPTGEKEDEALS